MKKWIMGAAISALGVSSPLLAEDFDQWLQDAQMGIYAPEQENWEEVLAAALGEPPLQVYMTSSRVNQPIETFAEMYPELVIEGVNIPASEMQERVRRERASGNYNIGLLHADAPETYLAMFGDDLVSYVPPEYKDIIPEGSRDPLLVYRYLPTGVTYNPSIYPEEAPVTNIWDLTTEEFRGKVLIADPLQTGSVMTYLTSLIGMEEEMAAAYEARFGKPVELSEASAGWEFMRRLLDNDPVIVGGTRDVAEAITNSDELLVGFNNFSRMREVPTGRYNFTFVMGLEPFDMVNLPTHLTVMAGNPSPNAAKLFVRHLLSNEGGAPWFEAGNPPSRTDWTPSEEWAKPIIQHTKVAVDYQHLLETTDDFIDFWTINR